MSEPTVRRLSSLSKGEKAATATLWVCQFRHTRCTGYQARRNARPGQLRLYGAGLQGTDAPARANQESA